MPTDRKNEECICPKCKSDDTVVDDFDFDYNCMVRKMYCEACGHSWREYFAIAYDGYSDDEGEYDANGVMLESYKEEK